MGLGRGRPGQTADGTLPWLSLEFDTDSTKILPGRYDVYYLHDGAGERVVTDHSASGRSRPRPRSSEPK
jgi:hypothetical protein